MNGFTIDLNAIGVAAEKLNSGGMYLRQQSIPANGEIEIRLLPPKTKIKNGLFYLKVISYWLKLDGKKANFISPKTIGDECPIDNVINQIKSSGHAEGLKLLESEDFSRNEEYYLPCLHVETQADGSIKLKSDEPQIFICSWKTISAIAAIVSHKQYQIGTDLGILDPAKGRSLIIKKTVEAKNTSYNVIAAANPSVIDPSLIQAAPDVISEVNRKIYKDEYLQGIALQYFTNGPKPSEDQKYRAHEASASTIAEVNPFNEAKPKVVEEAKTEETKAEAKQEEPKQEETKKAPSLAELLKSK